MHLLKNKTHFIHLLPFLMVILLDIMGIVLVMPVLVPLILEPSSGLLPTNTPVLVRDFLYGFSIGIFPLFMFFSTPILGDLSDKFGRKKLLLICLVGSALSYFISACAIALNSIVILLLSRAFAGLVAGTQPIATAAVIDLSSDENKTKHLALVVFTQSIALILGPLLGGITADKNLVSWFSYKVPFIFAAILSLINAIYLHYALSEKIDHNSQRQVDLTKGFILFITAFFQKKFRFLSFLYCSFVLAWSLYFQTINWLLMQKYHYSAGQLGIFTGFIGIIFAFTSSIGVRLTMNFFRHETNAYAFFVLIMAIACMGCVLISGEVAQWFWVVLIAGSNVICATVILSVYSRLAGSDTQGWIMGVIGALSAFTWALAGIIAGPLGYLNIFVPLITASILCLISFGLMLRYQKLHA